MAKKEEATSPIEPKKQLNQKTVNLSEPAGALGDMGYLGGCLPTIFFL